MGLVWLLTELHWLFWAYRLEFLGENTFLQVWLASLLFFAVNVMVLAQCILAFKSANCNTSSDSPSKIRFVLLLNDRPVEIGYMYFERLDSTTRYVLAITLTALGLGLVTLLLWRLQGAVH